MTPANGSAGFYKALALLFVGGVLGATLNLASWLIRADHDNVKGTADQALALGLANKEQLAILSKEVQNIGAGQREMLQSDGQIIANQALILRLLKELRSR